LRLQLPDCSVECVHVGDDDRTDNGGVAHV
jgi:hypothetical protein